MSAYCGIGDLPEGKHFGTTEECLRTGQVRRHGLKRVDINAYQNWLDTHHPGKKAIRRNEMRGYPQLEMDNMEIPTYISNEDEDKGIEEYNKALQEIYNEDESEEESEEEDDEKEDKHKQIMKRNKEIKEILTKRKLEKLMSNPAMPISDIKRSDILNMLMSNSEGEAGPVSDIKRSDMLNDLLENRQYQVHRNRKERILNSPMNRLIRSQQNLILKLDKLENSNNSEEQDEIFNNIIIQLFITGVGLIGSVKSSIEEDILELEDDLKEAKSYKDTKEVQTIKEYIEKDNKRLNSLEDMSHLSDGEVLEIVVSENLFDRIPEKYRQGILNNLYSGEDKQLYGRQYASMQQLAKEALERNISQTKAIPRIINTDIAQNTKEGIALYNAISQVASKESAKQGLQLPIIHQRPEILNNPDNPEDIAELMNINDYLKRDERKRKELDLENINDELTRDIKKRSYLETVREFNDRRIEELGREIEIERVKRELEEESDEEQVEDIISGEESEGDFEDESEEIPLPEDFMDDKYYDRREELIEKSKEGLDSSEIKALKFLNRVRDKRLQVEDKELKEKRNKALQKMETLQTMLSTGSGYKFPGYGYGRSFRKRNYGSGYSGTIGQDALGPRNAGEVPVQEIFEAVLQANNIVKESVAETKQRMRNMEVE